MESFEYRYPDVVSLDKILASCRKKDPKADAIQLLQEFNHPFRGLPAGSRNANWKGAQSLALLTAILELGAFVGALMAGPLADMFSRKVGQRVHLGCQAADILVLYLWMVCHFHDRYRCSSRSQHKRRMHLRWSIRRWSRSRRPIHVGTHVQCRTRSTRDPRFARRSATTRHYVWYSRFVLDRLRYQLYRRNHLPRTIECCLAIAPQSATDSRVDPLCRNSLPSLLSSMAHA